MKQLLWLLCVGLIFLAACRRKREPVPVSPEVPASPVAGQSAAPSSSPAPAPAPAPLVTPGLPESIPAQHFSQLSQALLTFRRDKQRAPKDWQELISTGYLKQMPIAPPGRRYIFDRSLNVQMVPGP